MVAAELTKAQKEAIQQKFILRRQRKTVLPLWYHLACILFVVGVSIGQGISTGVSACGRICSAA